MISQPQIGNVQVYFRGNFIPLEDANVNILTQALHYGTAIFEGIRGYWDEDTKEIYFFRLREHYERLIRNCKLLKISLPLTATEMYNAVVLNKFPKYSAWCTPAYHCRRAEALTP